MIPPSARLDFCDLDHQAVAFIGSCPVCRRMPRHPRDGIRPLEEGGLTTVPELKEMLKELYEEGGRRS